MDVRTVVTAFDWKAGVLVRILLCSVLAKDLAMIAHSIGVRALDGSECSSLARQLLQLQWRRAAPASIEMSSCGTHRQRDIQLGLLTSSTTAKATASSSRSAVG